ncbi:putative bifunctional diguanylate cyclase/phosphodiesterase [Paraburkholderia sp. DGU8]|uniref:putative bifunctional diguanylate cyclase/phosphodiesterase n=1 Tax=Paraburkholderia sp. DGU8 TaxID=3161997 RepID=UPI0034658A52
MKDLIERLMRPPEPRRWVDYIDMLAALATWAVCAISSVAAALRGGPAVAVGLSSFGFFAGGYVVVRLQKYRRMTHATEELTRGLLAANRDCLKLLDCDGRIRWISDVGRQLMRAETPAQLLGADWLAFWTPSDAREAFEEARTGLQTSFFASCLTLSGETKWWRSDLVPLNDRRAGTTAILCASHDVSAEVESTAELRRNAGILQQMEDHVQAVFWLTSSDFQILHHVSAGFASVWEMPLSELHQNPAAWRMRVHPDDLKSLLIRMRAAARNKSEAHSFFRLLMPDGPMKWIRADVYPVKDENGTVARLVTVCVDATEERTRLQQLETLAQSDGLTGLLNRRAMLEALSKCCQDALPFALLYIDLDRFKVLNDAAGHSLGDSVIKELARRIRKTLPDHAVVSRPGGCDEFTIIVPGEWERRDIDRLCQRLVACARRPFSLAGKTLSVTISVGAALFPEHGGSPEALFTGADLAMQAAKRAGRNAYRLFGAEEQGDRDRLQLERELREAVRDKQFVLFYQPQFCARSGRLTGMEALLRWNHPNRGQVSPGEFVPLLEETGLIIPVGYGVVLEAIGALSEFRRTGAHDISLSINVSARQFHDSGLVDVIRSTLQKNDINGSQLVVEITESTLMQSFERAREILAQLRLLNVRIAIDDFGTGYSSLSYVTRFRPDILKLDKSLVDDVAADHAANAVVDAVIGLAHKLNIVVVAEGVETEAQLDILRSANCDEIQGYLLGKPEPYQVLSGRFLDQGVA